MNGVKLTLKIVCSIENLYCLPHTCISWANRVKMWESTFSCLCIYILYIYVHILYISWVGEHELGSKLKSLYRVTHTHIYISVCVCMLARISFVLHVLIVPILKCTYTTYLWYVFMYMHSLCTYSHYLYGR